MFFLSDRLDPLRGPRSFHRFFFVLATAPMRVMVRVQLLSRRRRRRMDQALPWNVHDDRRLSGPLTVFIFERVEHLHLGMALQDQLALLVFSPQLDLSEVATVLAEAIGDAAFANDGVSGPNHLDEADAVLPQLRTSSPIGNQLRQKTH